MKKWSRSLVLVLVLGVVVFGSAQAQGYVIIGGQIVDKASGNPIPYARIGIMTKGTGTIANENGEFYYRFPKIAAEENVTVAVMGYKNYHRKGSDFTPNDRQVRIELEVATPVVVDAGYIQRFEARSLVSAALAKIAQNYPETPVVMTGFYHETLQQNEEYVDIREAILKVEKDPRPKIEVRDKVRLLRGRRYQSTLRAKVLDGYEFPNGTAIVTRGLETGVPEYLAGSNLSDYTFQLDDTIAFYNQKDVYRIRFAPANANVKAARNGIICINKTDSAVVRIEYDFTPSGMNDVFQSSMKSTFGKVLGKNRREARRVSSFTNYVPYNGRWYLQDAQLLIQTLFADKADTLEGTIRLHFVVNDILKSNGNAIPVSDQLLDTGSFPAQSVPKYDEVYWANFNHIIPSAAMRRITESLKK